MLDVDGETRYDSTIQLFVRYYAIRYAYPMAHLRIDITRHGYHIISDILCSDALKLRAIFGDCSGRLSLDSERILYWQNVLWDTKEGFEVREIAN